jgi:hypothetical protein
MRATAVHAAQLGVANISFRKTSNEFGNPDISAFIIREMAADIGGEFDGRPDTDLINC